MKSKRKDWVDAVKCVAILAVILDHLYDVIYSNPYVARASFCSVTLFVFLGGVTSFYSNRSHIHEMGAREIVRRLGAVLVPYAGATAIYLIFANRFFDVKTYIDALLKFDQSGHFYYILFFIQLTALSPVLYKIIAFAPKKKTSPAITGVFYHSVVFFVLLVFAFLSIKYTNVLPAHGGGKYILGGTYLPIYYLGMLFASKDYSFTSWKKNLAATLITFIPLASWFIFYSKYESDFWLDAYLPFGQGFNPPSITLFLLGILAIAFFFCLFTLMSNCSFKAVRRSLKLLVFIGSYSLYIFLYHIIVIDYIYPLLPTFKLQQILTIPLCIAVPILIKMLIDFVKKAVAQVVHATAE